MRRAILYMGPACGRVLIMEKHYVLVMIDRPWESGNWRGSMDGKTLPSMAGALAYEFKGRRAGRDDQTGLEIFELIGVVKA